MDGEMDGRRGDESLWILFRLRGQLFAIKSYYVASILLMEEKVKEIPESPDFIRGVYNLRGQIIPMADTRKLFGMETLEMELEKFGEMLEARKQDHLIWARELRRTIEQDEAFTMSTDPHGCKFGKWYDSFETDQEWVMFHLRKVEEPHRLLHELAHEVERLRRNPPPDQETLLQECLNRLDNIYVKGIVEVLDETVHALNTSRQELALVLGLDGTTLGLIVDSVEAADQPELLIDKRDAGIALSGHPYFEGVGKFHGELVLLLEMEPFREMSREQKNLLEF